MKRIILTGGLGVMVLAALLLALGNRTATTVWADPSTLSLDLYMDDPVHAAPPACTTNDGDGLIEEDDCPDVGSTWWIQPEGGAGGIQSWTDLASLLWTTDPVGADVTGDTIPDPTAGLAVNQPNTIGAKVGQLNFRIATGLDVGAVSTSNNVDDVSFDYDASVTGQPIPCGASGTLVLEDTFELWNAIIDSSNGTVSHLDVSGNTVPDTRDPMDASVDPVNFPNGYPAGCDGTPGKECAPRGVVQMPAPIPGFVTALGFPPGSDVMRAFGIAKLPLFAGITNDIDIAVLVYTLHATGSDVYLIVTVPGYAPMGVPSLDPTDPAYDALAQTVLTCPPYYCDTLINGVTDDPDFDEDATLDMTVTPEMINRVIGSEAYYAFFLQASTIDDFDGDTIPGYADRCDTDSSTGSATDDTDGDTLTGTCDWDVDVDGDTNVDAEDFDCDGDTSIDSAEGCNPAVDEPRGDHCGATGSGYQSAYPFAAGQDVDCDGYLNLVDNCPTVADADMDGDTNIDYQLNSDGDSVGDVCDADPSPGEGGSGGPINCHDAADNDGDTLIDSQDPDCGIHGDGHGYASPAPGTYVENPQMCFDLFRIGDAEPAGEDADLSYKYCLASGVADTADQDEDGMEDGSGPVTAGTGDCNNDLDDDGDTKIDEADPECRPFADPYWNPAPWVTRQAGYRDSDADGTPDFWDGRTSASPAPAGEIPYDYFDETDEDGDGYSDGCESFQGFDALDPSNAPGTIPGDGDCDGDTTSDEDEVDNGTNPLGGIESDGDGYCSDAEETFGAAMPAPGSTCASASPCFSPTDWWDVYDVPVPANKDEGTPGDCYNTPPDTGDAGKCAPNGVRNGAVSFGDVGAVLFYSGAAASAAPNEGVCGDNPNGNGVDYDCDKNLDGVPDGLDYDRAAAPATPPFVAGAPDTAIGFSDVGAALAQTGLACTEKGAN